MSKDDVYPDIHGLIEPDLDEVHIQQEVVTENGIQKIKFITKREKKAKALAEELKNYGLNVDEKKLLTPLPKKSPSYKSIRHTPNFPCDASNYFIDCEGHRKKAHIITRQATHISSDKKNHLGLCEAHEKWFNRQPLKEWYRFVRQNHPEQFVYMTAKARFVIEQTNEFLEVAEEKEVVVKEVIRATNICSCTCHARYPDWYCLKCIQVHQPQKTI